MRSIRVWNVASGQWCMRQQVIGTGAADWCCVEVTADKVGEPAERSKRSPLGAPPQDGGRHGHRLHVGHRRWATIQAHIRRERRFQARLALQSNNMLFATLYVPTAAVIYSSICPQA